jgi:hypothetical protein
VKKIKSTINQKEVHMKQFIQKPKQAALKTILAILFILGLTSLSVGQGWTFKKPMPTARGFLSGAVLDGKIYVIGGAVTAQLTATPVVEMYDPATDEWLTMAPMPEGRCAHATCSYNGKIYVFGGASPDLYSAPKNNVFEYDPQTNTWTTKGDMPYAITTCATAVLNDTIYLIGGGGVYWSPDSTVVAYDPLTESWSEKTPMNTARGCLSACVVNGKIFVIGGTTQDYHTVSYQINGVYDPSTNSWITKKDMPTGRFGLGTAVLDGKIYTVGGWRHSGVLYANEMYDPATDEWESKPALQERRFLHFLGTVGNKIYAIGGAYPIGAQPNLLSSNEEYDPEADPTAITSNEILNPTSFALYQNYPNPFNPETIISYSIIKSDRVTLKIYDILGKEEECLVDEFQNGGSYRVNFKAKNLSSGIYFYKLQVGNEVTKTMKMLLLR